MNFDDLVQQKEINLVRGNLRDGDLDVLVEVMQKSEVLEVLHLWDNHITLANGGKFTDALAHNQTLKILTLRYKQIGVEEVKNLAEALKVNDTLKGISLYGNQIGDEGAKPVSEMVNESLQKIDLDKNNIGNEGAQILAVSFKENQSLRMIDLWGNKIGDEGAEKLANALKCNPLIEGIRLGNNRIGSHLREKIKTILENPIRKKLQEWSAKKDGEIKYNEEKIQDLKKSLAAKEEEITLLKAENNNPLAQLEKFITANNETIASLEAKLKNSRPIIDTVDMISEANERENKRPRTGDAAKSNLAILHEQNQKVAHVKQEMIAVEATLENVQEEKDAVEADLEEVRGDLEDSNELVGQQAVFTDIWQGRFDELAALVEAGQNDGATISAIRNRPTASGS